MVTYTVPAPGTTSQYLFINGEGKVVGHKHVAWDEHSRPAEWACELRDLHFPNCIVAVVLGGEPRYVEKEEGTQMPKGFDTKSYHSSEDEQCQ